jgi:predicted transcriptional regulator
MGAFTDKEEELIRLLSSMEISRNVARTLVCLQAQEECTSVQIERATGLRQPEVSIAIQELRDRGWVAKKDIRRSRKGRPVHNYRLARPFAEIIAAIDAGEKSRIRKMEQALGRLRTLVRKGS